MASPLNSAELLRELITIHLKTLKTIQREGILPSFFYENTTLIQKSEIFRANKKNSRPVSLMNTDAPSLKKTLTNHIQV